MAKGRKTKLFKPSDAQRRAVSMLAALHVSHDEIRLLVINPHSQEPIAKTTLHRFFKKELSRSSAALKELVASKYFEALERGDQWAVRAGLRQRFNWVFEGSQPLPPEAIGSFADTPEIKIVFYPGPGKPEFDLTPPKPSPNPYSNAAPDLSRPAIEAPRSTTVDTGYPGLGPWRTERDPNSWMK